MAPGLFEGAKAWAEEAVPAGAAPKPAAAVCALTPEQLAQQAGISPAELRIIQSLSARRAELDARDTDMASMLPLLTAAEQKLDARVQALEAVKAEVAAMLGQVDEKQKAETDRLVAVYSAMRPREAARVFATLDDDVRLPVAAAMRRALAAAWPMDPPAPVRPRSGRRAAQQPWRPRRAAPASSALADVAAAARRTDAQPPPASAAPARRVPQPPDRRRAVGARPPPPCPLARARRRTPLPARRFGSGSGRLAAPAVGAVGPRPRPKHEKGPLPRGGGPSLAGARPHRRSQQTA